jgi:hypothetical protein
MLDAGGSLGNSVEMAEEDGADRLPQAQLISGSETGKFRSSDQMRKERPYIDHEAP